MTVLSHKLSFKWLLLDKYQMAVLIFAIVAGVLISWLLFYNTAMFILNVICTSMIAAIVVITMKLCQLNFLLKPLIVTIVGGVGMLIGSILDFGQLGLLMFSSLCITAVNNNNLESITNMVALAPWSHIGMWLSCSISLFMVESRYSPLSICGGIKHLFCLIGMLFGMILVHALPINSMPFFNSYPFAVMWLGMSAGMLSFYLFFDALINRRFVDINIVSID